jgi:hypothetical protein
MTENGSEEGLLVRAEPLGLAEEVCRRMVDVVRVVDGALLLKADLIWALRRRRNAEEAKGSAGASLCVQGGVERADENYD